MKSCAGDSAPLRVLHVIHSGSLGGGPEMVRTLAFAEDGAIHAVVSSSDGPLLDDVRRRGIETFEIEMTHKHALPMASVRLRRLVREWRPDVVVCCGQFAGFVGALALLGLHHRLIYVAAWPSFYSDKSLASRARNWVVERLSVARAAVVVPLSDADLRQLTRRRLLPPGKATVIRNAVDHRAFFPDPCAFPGKRIGFVGRLVADKGVDVLMDAVALLGPDEREGLEVVIVGEGEERARLERQASDVLSTIAPPKPSIVFAGPSRVGREWFTSSRLIVVPSRQEPFGIVALEGMACGVPVVAARSGGLAEIIEHGVTGLLVSPGSAAELAAAITSVLTDPALRARLASDGRRAIEARFSNEQHLARYQAIYRDHPPTKTTTV